MFRRGGRVRAVRQGGHEAAIALALTDPVTNALAGARLRELGRSAALSQEFSLVGEERSPEGLLWHGVNLNPISATDRALEDFGRQQSSRPRRSSSVVGDRRAVDVEQAEIGERGDVLPQVRLTSVQGGRPGADRVEHRDEHGGVDVPGITDDEPGPRGSEVGGESVGRGGAHASSCRRVMGVETISRARTTASVSGAL